MAPPELTSSAATIDKLPDEVLTEVLLRVPTPAALVHAAVTSKSLRRVIATRKFLAEYRERHKSSPFLGLYVPPQVAGPPSFVMPNSIHCADQDTLDRDLRHAALKASGYDEIRSHQDHRLHDAVDNAFILGPLEVHPDCRLLDCHNSRLLLTRGDEALEVRSPLAGDTILVPFPPDAHPDYLEACLLQRHDDSAASFLVVYLQHRRVGRNRQARAVEYDSSRKSWQDHPWQTLKYNIEGTPQEVMHTGHWMFCRYRGRSQAALMLDTRKMELSVLPLPTDSNFAIGEIEDNVCCLVESVGCADHRLRVWQLDKEKLEWDLKKDIKMAQVLGEHVGYYHPRAISNGIALVCSTTLSHQFVLDLNTCRLMDKFEFVGRSAHIMQMPWPPVFSGPTVNAAGGLEDGGPVSLGNAKTGAGVLSPGSSLGDCFNVDPSQEARLLCSSSIDSMCSMPGTNCNSQDIALATAHSTDMLPTSSLPAEYIEDQRQMALTTARSPSYSQEAAGGFDWNGGQASVGDARIRAESKKARLLCSSSIACSLQDFGWLSMFSYLGKWIPCPAATVLPKMAAPSTVMKLTSISTTINSLPTELLIEVLLRIPTPAALIHAAAASRSWRGAIATAEFLTCYRKHHKSFPFLGLYFRGHFAGPPSFEFPDSIHCAADDTVDRDLKDAALKAVDIGGVRRYQDHRLHDAVDSAFIHRRLGVHPDCCLLDCHNSRRLLTRGGEALEVRSPLARETILLPFPPDVVHPDSLQACLLQGHDEASLSSFRVVYLQHRYKGCKQQVRAVEYDSSRKSWQDHPWETLESNIKGTPGEVMHAGHRIFCKYIGWTVAALLLDTRKMEFSVLPLPSDSNFTIGEIEDNACGLVETVGYERQRLRVWQLDEEKLDWKLKKDIEMGQVLGEHDECYRPCAISNGIALVCSVTTCRHVLVNLNTCSMKNKFKFRGRSAYLMQMPWPPAFSHATANGGFGQDGGPTSDRTEAGESDEIERSPGPSLGGSFGTDPTQKVKKSDVQIATSCCTEASAASTVSSGECKPLLGPCLDAIKIPSFFTLSPSHQFLAACMEH